MEGVVVIDSTGELDEEKEGMIGHACAFLTRITTVLLLQAVGDFSQLPGWAGKEIVAEASATVTLDVKYEAAGPSKHMFPPWSAVPNVTIPSTPEAMPVTPAQGAESESRSTVRTVQPVRKA